MEAVRCHKAMAYQSSICCDVSKSSVIKRISIQESVVVKCEFDSHADTPYIVGRILWLSLIPDGCVT
jgi:hypothetical protein